MKLGRHIDLGKGIVSQSRNFSKLDSLKLQLENEHGRGT